MNTKKISESEYAPLCIAALPSRPTASSAFGGRGYTATQLKEAFDRLPLLLIRRFNALLDDIGGEGNGSLASEIPTGLESGHTLAHLFEDLKSGTFSTYLDVGGRSLYTLLTEMESQLATIILLMGDHYSGAGSFLVDCGAPSDRAKSI